MSKKTKSPWKMLADCVGTAIVSVAIIPALIVDAAVSSFSQ